VHLNTSYQRVLICLEHASYFQVLCLETLNVHANHPFLPDEFTMLAESIINAFKVILHTIHSNYYFLSLQYLLCTEDNDYTCFTVELFSAVINLCATSLSATR
jgi:hypothetical protein